MELGLELAPVKVQVPLLERWWRPLLCSLPRCRLPCWLLAEEGLGGQVLGGPRRPHPVEVQWGLQAGVHQAMAGPPMDLVGQRDVAQGVSAQVQTQLQVPVPVPVRGHPQSAGLRSGRRLSQKLQQVRLRHQDLGASAHQDGAHHQDQAVEARQGQELQESEHQGL